MKYIIAAMLSFCTTAALVASPIKTIEDLYRKIDIISTFNDSSVPHFFIDCGDDISVHRSYTHNAWGFDIGFYDHQKQRIGEGGNVFVSIVRERFFQLIENYGEQYRELLGDHYDEIINRLEKGEKFFVFEKGKVNKIILCGQTNPDIKDLAADALSPTFIADSPDSDGDGLPDYIELIIGTDPYNPDTDGDGLSDYDEIFKYRTNPLSKDTDDDGIPDGDWNERREYTYTIAAKREIYMPYDTTMMSDFFQDSRVIEIKGDTLIHEVILYPDAINFIIPSTKPQATRPEVQVYTRPSFFCNYTQEMSDELLGVTSTWATAHDFDLLTHMAEYALIISNTYPSMEPLNFYINVVDDRIDIIYRERFDQFKTAHFTTDQSVLDNLTFGASMYKNRMRGACGSSSIFYTTLLRALGFPTRILVSNPIVDFTDPEQVAMADNLKNERYKAITLSKEDMLRGYANHFFYEVNINGNWVRCDYNNVNLGCVHMQGLFIIQDKIKDISDVDYVTTWGKRMVEDKGNAYKTLELSDQFAIHDRAE